MKHLFIPALLCCGLAATARNNLHIRGHIAHQLADSVKIAYSLPGVKYTPVQKDVLLEKGNFSVALDLPDGYTSLTITNGNEQTQLYVQPGSDLNLSVDAANFDSTLHYEGTGKEIANYSAKCVLEQHSIRYIDQHAQMLASKDLPEYRAAIKELLDKEGIYLQKNGGALPADFKKYINAAIYYEVYYTMHMYPAKIEMYRHKSNSIKEIPAENYAIIDDIPELFNDSYINMPSYSAYLTNFLSSRISAANARNNTQPRGNDLMDSVMAMAFREMPPLTAEYFLGKRIYSSIKYTDVGETEREYAVYKKHFPNSSNLVVLEDAIALKKDMGPGKNAIDFDINTPDGKHMKLSDLKGKAVYIDFWSRGCVPCVAEMADAKKIREHFRNKEVVFVYISLDSDEEVWKKAIADFHIEGINTHVDKDYSSETVKKYGVTGIPCHFLIDKNGNFCADEVVQGPGNEAMLTAQIEKLL